MATKGKKKTQKGGAGTAPKAQAAKKAPDISIQVKPDASPAVKEEAKAPEIKVEAKVPEVKVEAKAPEVKKPARAPEVKAAAKAPAKAAPKPAVKAEKASEPAPKEEAAKVESPRVEAPKTEAPKTEAPKNEAPRAKPAAKAKGDGPEPRIKLTPSPDGSKLTPVEPRPVGEGNPYKPLQATVLEVIDESPNIKSIRVTLDDPEEAARFTYEPGQVGQLSVFGSGESTFVINTPPSQKDYLQFSVMLAGEVTRSIHNLCKGDKVGVRAPLGRPFPYDLWKGKKLFFIGGGIGMAPIRTIMLHCLEHAEDYGQISLLYGCKTPELMPYKYELQEWMDNPHLDCTLTVDIPDGDWAHEAGMIPDVLRRLAPSPENCVAILCGPPVMIKFTLQALDELHFPHENVYTTLEKRMKCGIGICGRCGIGGKYVCLDGPVFSQKELDALPPEL